MTYRNRKLLDVAHSAPCMFRVPGICESGKYPSVPCHSNQQRHGRGHGHKSADVFAPAGCQPCHLWYDVRGAPREEQENTFQTALERWLLWLFENEKVVIR